MCLHFWFKKSKSFSKNRKKGDSGLVIETIKSKGSIHSIKASLLSETAPKTVSVHHQCVHHLSPVCVTVSRIQPVLHPRHPSPLWLSLPRPSRTLLQPSLMLIEEIKRLWCLGTPRNKLKTLSDSMPRRLQHVIEANGEMTK